MKVNSHTHKYHEPQRSIIICFLFEQIPRLHFLKINSPIFSCHFGIQKKKNHECLLADKKENKGSMSNNDTLFSAFKLFVWQTELSTNSTKDNIQHIYFYENFSNFVANSHII